VAQGVWLALQLEKLVVVFDLKINLHTF